jgi:DNA-binding NarL/FixJ family response regulator
MHSFVRIYLRYVTHTWPLVGPNWLNEKLMTLKVNNTSTFLIVAIILVACKAIGQKSGTPKTIDSLYKAATSLPTAYQDSIYLIAKKIFNSSTQISYPRGIVKGKLLASYYFLNRFKLDTAKNLLAQCEAFYLSNPGEENTLDHGAVLFYQSAISMRQQNYQLSEQQAQQALKIYSAIHSEDALKNKGFVLRQLGNIELLQDNLFKSLNYFSQAYKVLLDAGVPPANTASTLSSIADICIRMGQHEKALDYAKKSLETLTANEHNRIAGLITVGNIFARLEKYDSAIHYYQLSKEIALKNSNLVLVQSAESEIARIYTILGKYQQSLNLLNGLRSGNAAAHRGMSKQVDYLLSTNYLNLNKYDSSIYFGRLAYKSAKASGSKQLIISNSKILSNAFKNTGKADSALHYLRIHNTYNDSIYNIENLNRLSTLYAELETIEKQNEIQLLVKEQAIQKVKTERLQFVIVFVIILAILIITTLILNNKNRKKKQKLLHVQLLEDIEKKKQDLEQQAVRIHYINNSLMEVEATVRKIKTSVNESKQEAQQILNTLHINKLLDKEWENFNTYFGNVHEGFFNTINTRFPDLTVAEKRLASLVRMNLPNREIASLTNTEASSVKVAKYRLKKKLQLTDEQDIHTFLQNLGLEIQPLHQN